MYNLCYESEYIPEKNINSIKVFKENSKGTKELIYEYIGFYLIKRLDNCTLLIIELGNSKKTLYADEHINKLLISLHGDAHTISKFEEQLEDLGKEGVIKKIKKAIVKIGNRLAIYSYEFGIVVSACFDSIKYSDEDNEFLVSYNLVTKFGLIKLYGVLNKEGYLYSNTLYFFAFGKSITINVNPENLDESIKKQLPKIEKIIERQKQFDKKRILLENECDMYLRRKKGSQL